MLVLNKEKETTDIGKVWEVWTWTQAWRHAGQSSDLGTALKENSKVNSDVAQLWQSKPFW